MSLGSLDFFQNMSIMNSPPIVRIKEVDIMIAEDLHVIASRICKGSRLRLELLPGWGDMKYLPAAAIKTLRQILAMKVRDEIDINPYDLIALNAIRSHGYYGPCGGYSVEIVLMQEPDPDSLELLSVGLKDLKVLS